MGSSIKNNNNFNSKASQKEELEIRGQGLDSEIIQEDGDLLNSLQKKINKLDQKEKRQEMRIQEEADTPGFEIKKTVGPELNIIDFGNPIDEYPELVEGNSSSIVAPNELSQSPYL